MKRILIFVSFIFLLLIAGCFMWFQKDENLKFIPKEADFIVLIDVKKVSQQYIFSLIKHPKLWFGDSDVSLKSNGIKIPDYIQIFHLKNKSFSEWYSILEISNKDNFLNFLKDKEFKSIKKNIYTKDQISIKIDGSKCILGFSNSTFEKTANIILNAEKRKINADQLIDNSIGSISSLSDSRILNFSIDLNDDNIEIKNTSGQDILSPTISDLQKKASFLKLELDSKNIQKVSILFNKKLSDSLDINSISGVAELEMVNDKIISYSYDDNFNEVEKVSYQKILQPSYSISVRGLQMSKTWDYFQNKKWINAQNQFTPIPFQPNIIKKNTDNILIQSTKKNIDFGESFSENYIFVKNNQLLINSIKSLSKSEKKAISNLDYLFYGNRSENYYLRIKFKKEELPIILRW